MKNYYITTAIPFANAAPHIGTAMDYLYGDILLRYQTEILENRALMSIGTDEHGAKIAEKAAENNQTPQEFVDSLQPEFQRMREMMNLDFANILDIRTTDFDHKKRVQEIWRLLNKAGVIYKGKYEGWYCAGEERFFTDTEAKEQDYFCADHQKPLEKLEEENYYLRISKFTNEIREFAKNNIVPEFRGKEILELVKNGAQDVSISRPREKLSWGIPVPDDEDQTMYVWIDALSNYITVLNYPDKNTKLQDFWPADVEIVGKDILRFHAIIWLAMLLALKLELPKKILVHGHILNGGIKMSKSLGNVVSPIEIIENYGTDAFRYYFTRHIPVFDDGDFTWEKFENAYNGELANDLGNLVSRVANMINRYCDGRFEREVVQGFDLVENKQTEFKGYIGEKWDDDYEKAMKDLRFDIAIDLIWAIISDINRYIEIYKPWEKFKREQSGEEIDPFSRGPGGTSFDSLSEIARSILHVSNLLKPFLPETSARIREIFGGDKLPDEIPILFPKKYLHTPEPLRK